jgi:Protein of unknown function (DUF3225)
VAEVEIQFAAYGRAPISSDVITLGSQSPTWICFPEGWRIVAAISASLTSLER